MTSDLSDNLEYDTVELSAYFINVKGTKILIY